MSEKYFCLVPEELSRLEVFEEFEGLKYQRRNIGLKFSIEDDGKTLRVFVDKSAEREIAAHTQEILEHKQRIQELENAIKDLKD